MPEGFVVTDPLTVQGPPCVTAWALTVTFDRLLLIVVSVELPVVWRVEVEAFAGNAELETLTAPVLTTVTLPFKDDSVDSVDAPVGKTLVITLTAWAAPEGTVVTDPLTVQGPPWVTACALTVTFDRLLFIVVSVVLPVVWRVEEEAPAGRAELDTLTAPVLMTVAFVFKADSVASVEAPVGKTLEITVTAEADPPPLVVPDTDKVVPGAFITKVMAVGLIGAVTTTDAVSTEATPSELTVNPITVVGIPGRNPEMEAWFMPALELTVLVTELTCNTVFAVVPPPGTQVKDAVPPVVIETTAKAVGGGGGAA